MADELTKESLMKSLSDLKTELEAAVTQAADVKAKEAAEEKFKEKMSVITEVETRLKAIEDNATSKEIIAKLQEDMKVTVKAIDILQTRQKDRPFGGEKKILSIGEAIREKMLTVGKIQNEGEGKAERFVSEEIESALKSPGGSYTLKLGKVSLKAQGSDMTVANSLTGDPWATYNQRQAIQPSQKVNFRDLIPTTESPTGLYITYTENTGETNNIVLQTEGSTKGQNQYQLTEAKTVNGYISGFSVFSKQFLRNLPFIQGALTRMLLRDFYKAENSAFYTTVSGAATGPTSMGASPDDVKQLIALIGGQLDTNYAASFVVVSNSLMARLLQSTYTSGYYPGAGTVQIAGNAMTIWGTPIISASWVAAQKALMIDSDYLERVEVEGLNIAFSFEDSTNFRQNKVTARIECMEAINLMQPASACFADLGAS